LKIVNAN